MQVSSLEGLVGIILNKISKKNWTNTLDMLMHTIHVVEKDLKHLPGIQKKEIVIKSLQNLQTTQIVTSLSVKERQNFNKMLEVADDSIDLLVSAKNSKAFKKFKRNCFK
jgi:hypothetical protein